MEYKKTLSIDELTPKRLREYYLFGLDLTDSNGKKMPDDLIQNQIDSVIDWLESKCSTRFSSVKVYTPPDPDNFESDMVQDTDYDEIGKKVDWSIKDQRRFGTIQLPISKLVSVQRIRGCYDRRPFWEVPQEWIKPRLASIQVAPTIAGGLGGMSLLQGTAGQNIFTGGILQAQFANQYPQYWAVDYTYGHGAIPRAVADYICLTASIYTIEQFATSFSPGIAGRSMSAGNISQSLQLTASAEYSLMSAQVRTMHDRLTEKKSGYNLDEIVRKVRGLKVYSI